MEWAAWVEWVEWVEWECNHLKPLKVFKNAREINLSGVFFVFTFQCFFNVYSMSVASLFLILLYFFEKKFNSIYVHVYGLIFVIGRLMHGFCFAFTKQNMFLRVGGTVLTLGCLLGPNKHPKVKTCLLYTSPSPRDRTRSRMPSSA